jgi:predicted ester cyclase
MPDPKGLRVADEGSADRRSPHSVRFTPPADFSISVREKRSANLRVANQGERRQPMRGYEDTYVDIIDYIIRITDRIWEDQDVGYIYDTYRPACRIYDDSGPRYGVEGVVEHTLAAIHAFPDTRHYADDVIWAGNEDQGFATSHRAINVGHHLGPWRWGPPTGRKINLWVIANCVSEQNQIFEEWVLYNTAARLAQCGIDVRAAARAWGNEKLCLPLGERELTEVERLQGGRKPEPYPARGPGLHFDVEQLVRGLFHDSYNRRDLSAIDRVYATNVRWHGPSNREGYGRAAVRAMARGLLVAFPDLGLHVDEVYWMGNERDGFSVSVRWTALGTHRGYGQYGDPTGRRVHLWGLSQLYFEDGRIVEDWMLFNEFDVLAQLLRDDPVPPLPDRE